MNLRNNNFEIKKEIAVLGKLGREHICELYQEGIELTTAGYPMGVVALLTGIIYSNLLVSVQLWHSLQNATWRQYSSRHGP